MKSHSDHYCTLAAKAIAEHNSKPQKPFIEREKITIITWRKNRFNFTAIIQTNFYDYECAFERVLSDSEIQKHFKQYRYLWKHKSV